MTGDALRTQLAEVLCPPTEKAGHPTYSGLDCITHTAIADRLLPFVTNLLAAARAEGAAEALRDAAESVTELAEELGDAEEEAENADVSWALGVARLRAEVKAKFMQDRASALSAHTTEGDPT